MSIFRRRRVPTPIADPDPPAQPDPAAGGGQSVVDSHVGGDVYLVSGVAGDVTIRGGVTDVSWPVRVGVVPVLAHCYQPRAETDTLDEAVAPGATAVVTQVLSGLGGVGKSQLAAAYARSRSAEVDVLVWVSASSREAIQGAYAQAAAQLGQPVGGSAEAAAGWFLSWLQTTTDRRWLVVLDDVADPADLRGLWPDGPAGSVVVTTRRNDAALSGQGRRRIIVGLFTAADARAYLAAKVNAGPGSPRMVEADGLAADLGYLPLALAQAAAFITDRGESCAGYRARLADRRRTLHELFPPDALADDYQATVAATWSISIDAADQLPPNGLARPLLEILSVVDPNGVPTEVLEAYAAIRYVRDHTTPPATSAATTGATGPAPVVCGRDCLDALANLARLSLVSVDPEGGPSAVRVHALVQRAAREHLNSDRVTSLMWAAAAALLEVWPAIERDPQLGQVLRANSAILSDRYPDPLWDFDFRELLWRAGRSLGDCGLLSAAIEYWTHMVQQASRVLGPDHPDTLVTRFHLAGWRGRAGDPVGAAAAFEQLLTNELRVLGPDHPDTLATRQGLARERGAAGDPAGAVAANEQLLTDQLRVLGPDHPGTLTTRHNLADWRGSAGDPAGAVVAYEQLLPDRLRVLGPDDPDTLATCGNLADWRGRAGDPAGAAAASEQLLADQLRVLGPDHPETLTTRHSLADWRGAAGDPAGAVAAYELLLPDRLRVLGPDHPGTLATRHNLAYWRGEAGDGAGAVAVYEQVVADDLRVLGPDHPDALTTRHSLARWRGEAGDLAGAVSGYEQLLADCLRVLGPDHSTTLTTRGSLARWRGAAGDPAGAAAVYEQVLADDLRVLGPDHSTTLTTRHSLARSRGAAGAAAVYEQVLADRLRVLGPDHPDTLTARGSLADWRGAAGEAAGAAAVYEQVLADRLRVLGPDHLESIATRGNLARWRGEAGDLAGAVAASKQLLAC